METDFLSHYKRWVFDVVTLEQQAKCFQKNFVELTLSKLQLIAALWLTNADMEMYKEVEETISIRWSDNGCSSAGL